MSFHNYYIFTNQILKYTNCNKVIFKIVLTQTNCKCSYHDNAVVQLHTFSYKENVVLFWAFTSNDTDDPKIPLNLSYLQSIENVETKAHTTLSLGYCRSRPCDIVQWHTYMTWKINKIQDKHNTNTNRLKRKLVWAPRITSFCVRAELEMKQNNKSIWNNVFFIRFWPAYRSV